MSMSYLGQFQKHLTQHDYPSFLALWEEYCMGDEIDGEELKQILLNVKSSELAAPFGRHVENALVLWEKIQETDLGHDIIKLIFDLQTTNTAKLGELVYQYLKQRYAEESYFNEKIRLIGLREMAEFQGAISNYELLTHMKKGNFVFHTGGWGVGEILDISFLREQLELEFDYVGGKKDLSFQNAFKTLIPLPKDHFLALRFGNPDGLEEKAKKNAIETIHILLRDLGPLTAAEIKEELYELVIPKEEWTRWWQATRSKIKKDTMIEIPHHLKEPFKLREREVSHEEFIKKALEKKPDANHLIQIVYTFLRDFPQTLKNVSLKKELEDRLQQALRTGELNMAQELQLSFILEDLKEDPEFSLTRHRIAESNLLAKIINEIPIVAFKKRVLFAIRKLRTDWVSLFLDLFLIVDQNPLREYIFVELLKAKKENEIVEKLSEILSSPGLFPYMLLWYFQKIMKDSSIPFANVEGKNRFFEALLILLSELEQSEGNRDLIKKILIFLTSARYSHVRKIFQYAPKEAVQEFLLLATKCHSLNDRDIKIFHSLAAVVHPSLAKISKKYDSKNQDEDSVIWTTQEGYEKIRNRLHEISTTEIVANAKEIEEARAHGDLRENAEFKAALERRDRLQQELEALSQQFQKARVLTKESVNTEKVGVGVVIDCKDLNGEETSYTLLGPWDANPEGRIFSVQSNLGKSLLNRKIGDTISIQGKVLKILNLRNYFETL